MQNVFEIVRDNVTTRQVAEHYGLKINRHGMACCPFHDDKSPSLKLDKRYYCFGCGEKGDAIDYVAKIFGLDLLESAKKICVDFGLGTISECKHKVAAQKPRTKKSDEQIFQELEQHIFIVLSDYYHLLKGWKTEYAPRTSDEEWHPYFVEALCEIDKIAYQLDTLLEGDVHDRAFLISDSGKKVKNIEKRLQEFKQRGNEEVERSFTNFREKSDAGR